MLCVEVVPLIEVLQPLLQTLAQEFEVVFRLASKLVVQAVKVVVGHAAN